MDYDSSIHFLSSLAKFLQSLCNGYIQFDNGVQINGHLYLSIDTNKTVDYVLNEKVFKNNEECVTFTSDSFYAQPAQPPKKNSLNPGERKGKDKSGADDSGSSVKKRKKIDDPGVGIFSGNVLSSSKKTNQSGVCQKLTNEPNNDQNICSSKSEELSTARLQSSASSSISLRESNSFKNSNKNSRDSLHSHSQSFHDSPSLEDSFPPVTFQSDSDLKDRSKVHVKKEPFTDEDFVEECDEDFENLVKQEMSPALELDTDFSHEYNNTSKNSSNYLKDGSTGKLIFLFYYTL